MAKSLQDILISRQQEEFVGREEQLAFFRDNLSLAPEDPRRRFVISVSGQGGVGKTWLLRRFRRMAEEVKAITACTDEAEEDVPGVMGRIAAQFEAQDHPLETFTERYKVYRQRQQEIETDPDAPQGFPAFLGRTLAKGGVRLARRIPIGGVAADFVDEEAFASLAGDFAGYVARKIRNKDEVRLVLKPVEVLTPLFLADLQKVAKEHPLALFCDTYERTGSSLDPWLRDLLEGRHGDVPANILLVIAGRDELDRNLWAPYGGLLARWSLEPFAEEEARDYLTRKGVTDEQVVEVILRLSGRLPLLLATLAAESPDDPAKVGDPSGEAVERFRSWVDDPERRQVALDAALPRLLNRDVLAVLLGEDEVGELFAWIRGRPFVEKQGDGWAYHGVVRAQMLRYKRQESPQGWADLHRRLAEYYEGLRDGLRLEEEAGRRDETWQRYELETRYHRLCQSPRKYLRAALCSSLFAHPMEKPLARQLAEAICAAGTDVDDDDLKYWGGRRREGFQAYTEGRYQDVIDKWLTPVLNQGMLEPYCRPNAQTSRGGLYMYLERYDDALRGFEEALGLDPGYARAYHFRGRVYQRMEMHRKALDDLSQAVELDPASTYYVASLGIVHRSLGEYVEALTDFSRAIELDPDNAEAIANRGWTYLEMMRLGEALVDFNRAIELKPDYAETIAGRGIVYRQIGCHDDALIEFNHALQLDPELAWAISNRGETYRQMDRCEEALADLDRSIELDPDSAWSFAFRGSTYRQMERYKKALADFDQATAMVANLTWAIIGRGVTYLRLKSYDEALADFNRVIELEPGSHWYLYHRVLTYRAMGRTDEAQADLTAIIQVAQHEYDKEPTNWYNVLDLILYRLTAGEAEDAERLYREALSRESSPYRIREFIRHIDNFLVVFPNHAQAVSMRDLLEERLQETEQ